MIKGDEVVSLGWCFWHRGCFGCLMCGVRLEAPAVDGEEVEDGQGRKRERGTDGEREWMGKGKEVLERERLGSLTTTEGEFLSPWLKGWFW